MNEYILLVPMNGNPIGELSPERQQKHVQKVGTFIEKLAKEGKLKGAQPLDVEGVIISGKDGKINENPLNNNTEVIGGYYHILANNINEAIDIAKADPRFEDGDWKIEVRPIKKVEGIN